MTRPALSDEQRALLVAAIGADLAARLVENCTRSPSGIAGQYAPARRRAAVLVTLPDTDLAGLALLDAADEAIGLRVATSYVESFLATTGELAEDAEARAQAAILGAKRP